VARQTPLGSGSTGEDPRLGRNLAVSLLIIIIILVLLFGGGGGYYAHNRYGGSGLGGVLGLVVIVLVLLWLFGR
jgi:hypothetical protein